MIELLVVIAIIALLAALLLPALRSAREKAKAAGCINNWRQYGLGLAMYMDEWGGYYPPVLTGVLPSTIRWIDTLEKYIPTGSPGKLYYRLRCPLIASEINGSGAYSLGLNGMLQVWDLGPPAPPKKVDTLPYPADSIVIADSIQNNFPTSPHPYGGSSYILISESYALTRPGFGQVDYRHNKRANILYLDGHVIVGTVPFDDNSGENQKAWLGFP